MPHALEGLRVIDVAINYAGPTISMYLADQGADVIKVERRITGDTSRRSGNTPFLKLNSYGFMAINRGKRSITLDITKPQGQDVLRDLARGADVLVENFRPGVMERLGMTCGLGEEFDHPKLEEGHPLRRHVLYRLPRAAWEQSRAQ